MNRGLGGSAAGWAWAGRSRDRNDKKIIKVRNEIARRCRGAGNAWDILVPPGRDAAVSFIGGAREHLRDQPDVWVTGVTGERCLEEDCENGARRPVVPTRRKPQRVGSLGRDCTNAFPRILLSLALLRRRRRSFEERFYWDGHGPERAGAGVAHDHADFAGLGIHGHVVFHDHAGLG